MTTNQTLNTATFTLYARDGYVRTVTGSTHPDYGKFTISHAGDSVDLLRLGPLSENAGEWVVVWHTPGVVAIDRGAEYAETLAVACDFARSLNRAERQVRDTQ